jgi:dienelactone hydrolase
MARAIVRGMRELEVEIPIGGARYMQGTLSLPTGGHGLVIFAHGSGSSRFSPRNRFVAAALQEARLATLLMDLLTSDEEALDETTGRLRFDIELLAERVLAATEWVGAEPGLGRMSAGYFGASTGAAAALVAASRTALVRAVVSRGGRPDLAGPVLPQVKVPTLFIVGEQDRGVVELNQEAFDRLGAAEKDLRLVPRATHLFSEPGALEEVARLAVDWFERHL